MAKFMDVHSGFVGVTADQLREFLSKDFAKWQLPDSWAFIDQVPRTSVGKFDKKVIRKWYADEEITVEKSEKG